MKHIAIITWITYPNFGTYLQSYALQCYITSQGYECKVLDDASLINKDHNIKYEIKKCLWFLTSANYRAYRRAVERSRIMYERFKKDKIEIEERVTDIDYLNKQYDAFVCGSDQIWNPFGLAKNKAGFYYANFTDKKKIAYAPSIGVSSIPDEYKDKMHSLIEDFSFLSAREEEGVMALSALINREDVHKVVDPTLLLSKIDWERLLNDNTEKYRRKEKYALGYFLSPNMTYIDAAKRLARKRGLKFKMFFTCSEYKDIADEIVIAGPMEFLDAVNHADFIFTDSFHGSIFAAILNIQFVTFKRFRNISTSQNSRVENLLEMMNLRERLIDEHNIDSIEKLSLIDFNMVEKSIAPYINASEQYLKRALL